MTYYEFNERRTQQSVALDVVDWPAIVVTEGEPDEDMLLQMSLSAIEEAREGA